MKRRERERQVWMILSGILTFSLLMGFTATVAWSDNSLCLGCHQDESLKKEGIKLALKKIEAEEWANVWAERIKKITK